MSDNVCAASVAPLARMTAARPSQAAGGARRSGTLGPGLSVRNVDGAPSAGGYPGGSCLDDWIVDAPDPWWVVHTHARNEKLIAQALAQHHACFYLPLVSVHHTYAKSKASFQVPLFPGYLFVCGGHAECDVARRTNRVAQILRVDDQPRLRRELTQVYRAISSGKQITLYRAIQVGQMCRITRGPLQGTEGVVVRNGHGCRMYLAVSMLGQSAEIEIDAGLLESA
jgi:transcriptional antiterminator RfaH